MLGLLMGTMSERLEVDDTLSTKYTLSGQRLRTPDFPDVAPHMYELAHRVKGCFCCPEDGYLTSSPETFYIRNLLSL